MLKYYKLIIIVIETVLNVLIIIFLNIRTLFHRNVYPVGGQKIQIIGNGPSVSKDIDRILLESRNSESMVVNAFANTELFEKLQPRYYIIIDPFFFFPGNNQRHKEAQKKTINALVTKTHWELNIFVPMVARKSLVVTELISENAKIKVFPIKNIPTLGGSEKLNQLFFRLNLANPFFANVLIAAIFVSVKINFKKIIVWGADHSWHEDFYLGQDNIIYTPERHFFDKPNKINGIPYTNDSGGPMRFDEVLLMLSRGFRQYHSIEKYAKFKDITIKNYSSITWIDAFSRE